MTQTTTKHTRSNILVDRPFQIKATALIVALTILVAAPLGFLLLRTAHDAVEAGREAVDVGAVANASSTEALKQAELLNTRLAMESLLRLGDKPEIVAQLKAANAVETERLKKQGEAMKLEGAKLASQRDALERMRKTLAYGVVGGIAALIILVAFAGIFFTHKVAGPIHRMRLLFAEVGEGKFSPYRPLRKGDELQDFFADFSGMVEKLKERQKDEVARLDAAILKAEKAGVSDGSLYDLKAVRDAMEVALAGRPSEVMKADS